tara:strand:+ start:488 stop:763 length:276 start_codon:yes stop_codon:yes gene_type:complete
MSKESEEPIEEENSEEELVEVSPEQVVALLRRSELVSADRLVFLRSFEKFYTSIDAARTTLLNDIGEINNAISLRNQGVIPDSEDSASEEE